MKNMVNDILKRIKKLWVLLIALPLLTGAIAYFLEAKEPTSYTASASVNLGTFENDRLTNAGEMAKLLTSVPYLEKEILPKSNPDLDIKEKNLNVVANGTGILEFKVVSSTEEEANEIIHAVVDGFLAKSDSVWQEKMDGVNESIKALEEAEVGINESDRIDHLYKYNITKTNLENGQTEVLDEITVSTNHNNPIQRAVFGILVGIMLNILILFLPELFRGEREN